MKKSTKLILAGLILILTLFAGIFYFDIYKTSENIHLKTKIEAAIEQIPENGIANFSELVEGEWNRMIIVTPYTSMESVKENFHIPSEKISNDNIELLDTTELIIFCKDDQIENYIYLDKFVLDRAPELSSYLSFEVSRENSTFQKSEGNVLYNTKFEREIK